MKKLIFFLPVALVVSLASCSQCYECYTQSYITDGSGNVIDSTNVPEEICTADPAVIDEKEANGADCVTSTY